MEFLTITHATYAGGYRIEAVFSNGVRKMLDFSSLIKRGKGVVCKLADLDYFMNFTLDPFTIDWNGEVAFDPQDLYVHGVTLGYADPHGSQEGEEVAAEPESKESFVEEGRP